MSYAVDYYQVQGYMRWFLILFFMVLKAGLIIAVFMASVSVAWLIMDVFMRPLARRALGLWLPEPLCVRRRLVFCWKPDAADPTRSRPPATADRRRLPTALSDRPTPPLF